MKCPSLEFENTNKFITFLMCEIDSKSAKENWVKIVCA